MLNLKKQQEKVVRPLIIEAQKQEAIVKKLRTEVKERTANLKILFSMIRSPKLCDLFYKAERKRNTKKQMDKIHEHSVHTLR